MKLKSRMQAVLREAWFGPQPLREIARKTKLGETTIKDFWASLKSVGLLPAQSRPCFAKVTTAPSLAPVEPVDDDDLEPEADVQPAPLDAVDVLRKHHGAFESALFNSVPAKFLMMEFRRPNEGPTPGELRQAARDYDNATRAFR